MAEIIGGPRSFHKKFKFLVDIDRFGSAAFQTCSEIAMEAAVVEQWEGGVLISNKAPGRLTVDDITLERGATQDEDVYNWFLSMADASAHAGLVDEDYKRTVEIKQLDRDNNTLRTWRLNNAWPKRFVAGAWDNGADENVIETLVLAYDYPELT
jgi:phage tail-like protein